MRPGIVLFFVAFLVPALLSAGTTGKLAGKVTDRQTGEPLVGAIVQIRSLGTGAATDAEGYYYLINLPPGSYEVTTSYVGYARLTERAVIINVDRTTTLNLGMNAEAIQSQAVVVEAERMPIQRDQSSTIQSVDANDLRVLPVNTISGVLQLQTGVVSSGGDLHVRGGRSGEIGYYVDGYRIEDPLFNGAVLSVNNQAVQQLEFLSGTFNAEYGNALSGIVNIVTKEHAESFHGTITYKQTKLGLETASDNLNERYAEGTLSGPLWSGSPVGFLLSAKKTDAQNYYLSGQSRRFTDSLGDHYQTIEFSKAAPFGSSDYLTGLGKVFVQPFDGAKVTLLYNGSNRNWRNYDHTLRFIPDSSYKYHSSSQLVGLNFRHALSQDLFYELRGSAYEYIYRRSVNGMDFAKYVIPLGLRFDNTRFFRTTADGAFERQNTKTYSLKGDLTWQADRSNLIKTGFDLKVHDLNYFYVNNPANALARFDNTYHHFPWEGALYVQDKMEFETIVLSLGLRYDVFNPRAQYLTNPFVSTSWTSPDIQHVLSPRVGIAYPVLENMVFHFSYGQFFQRPEFQAMYEDLGRRFGVSEPIFGVPGLRPEKTASYEFGVTATVAEHATTQLTFFSKKIQDLIGLLWTYQPLAYATYVNEDFASVKGFEWSGRVRWSNLSASLNYTYSIAEGSSSSQEERYAGAFDVVGTQSLRFLPLDFDQRQTLNGNCAVEFDTNEGPFGFLPIVFENTSANLLATYGSGLPYTFNPLRARYVPDQNNSRLPANITVDLLVQKEFRIDPVRIALFADIRNLFDRKNVRSVYGATGSPVVSGSDLLGSTPDYNQDPTNYFPPRTIYLGVTVSY